MWPAFKSVTTAGEIKLYCSFYKLQYTYCQVNKCYSSTFKNFTLIHTNTSLVTHILVYVVSHVQNVMSKKYMATRTNIFLSNCLKCLIQVKASPTSLCTINVFHSCLSLSEIK